MSVDPVGDDGHLEPVTASSGNWMTDHRARIALEESERMERKQQEHLEQSSGRNTPAERIRIWERRHGLTLPRDANHPIIGIVARQTNLALDQVREEQQRRSMRVDAEAATAPTAD